MRREMPASVVFQLGQRTAKPIRNDQVGDIVRIDVVNDETDPSRADGHYAGPTAQTNFNQVMPPGGRPSGDVIRQVITVKVRGGAPKGPGRRTGVRRNGRLSRW